MNEENRSLGRSELIGLSVGQVIGAGVITVLGAAIAETGRSAPWAYFLAVLFGFVAIIPYILVSSTLRVSGGDYSIVSDLGGDQLGGAFGLIKVTNMLPMALYGTSFAMYFASVFPSANKKIVGIVILTIFYLLNLKGVEIMAKVQKYMTGLLLFTMGLFIVFGMLRLNSNPLDYTTQDYFLNGSEGFMSAFVLLIYSTTGHYLTINYSKEAIDAKRDIPWAIACTSMIIAVVYTLTGIVASNVLPVVEVAGKPLTDVAREIFPPFLFLFYILFGPGMCLTTTMNSSMVSYTRPVYKAAEDGFLPTIFSKQNKIGVPYVMMTIVYLIGILPILFGLSVKTLTNNLVLVNYTTKIIVDIAIYQLPKKYPEQWKNSRLHMSNGKFYTINTISIFVQLIIAIWAAKNITTNLLLINVGYMVLAFFYAGYRYKNKKVKISRNVYFD